jgi:hypothetical protein
MPVVVRRKTFTAPFDPLLVDERTWDFSPIVASFL